MLQPSTCKYPWLVIHASYKDRASTDNKNEQVQNKPFRATPCSFHAGYIVPFQSVKIAFLSEKSVSGDDNHIKAILSSRRLPACIMK